MVEELSAGAGRRRRDGIFGGISDIDDSLLFFFLILVILFSNGCFRWGHKGDIDDSLLFFFLLLVILFCGDFWF